MYKLRMIDGLALRVLREEIIGDYSRIDRMLDLLEQNKKAGRSCLIVDTQQRALEAHYLSNYQVVGDGYEIINMMFDIVPADIQTTS